MDKHPLEGTSITGKGFAIGDRVIAKDHPEPIMEVTTGIDIPGKVSCRYEVNGIMMQRSFDVDELTKVPRD